MTGIGDRRLRPRQRVGAILPCESRISGLLGGPRRETVAKAHHCLGNAAQNLIRTLNFVRRNDILLQCGMALQAVPLPSLGVSSLDLGRSFMRTALFL